MNKEMNKLFFTALLFFVVITVQAKEGPPPPPAPPVGDLVPVNEYIIPLTVLAILFGLYKIYITRLQTSK